MDPSQPLPQPLAVIGAGQWGTHLIRNTAELNSLRCVCDADPAALERAAEVAPEARCTTSIDEVLADDEIRGVMIAAPAGLHASLAKQALIAGKDVFVEKPLALDYGEAQEIVALAEDRAAVLMVGHILEYHPAIVRLVELVRAGELGRLRYLYSNRLNLGRVRSEENILWSFAPHDVSVIERLVDAEPRRVVTTGGSYLQAQIADVTVTGLSFDGGVRAHIFVSWLHPSKEHRLVVIGEQKMAVFDGIAQAGSLTLFDEGIEFSGGEPVIRAAEGRLVPVRDQREPLRLECEAFLRCIADRSRPLTDGANGLAVLRVLEASQRSLDRGGVPVELSEVAAGAGG